MGGALGGIFSGQPQGSPAPGAAPGAPNQPSLLQKLVQGAAKGGLTGAGKGMQQQPGGGGGQAIPNAPSVMPVDSSYFRPMSPMNAGPMMPGNGQAPGTALYG